MIILYIIAAPSIEHLLFDEGTPGNPAKTIIIIAFYKAQIELLLYIVSTEPVLKFFCQELSVPKIQKALEYGRLKIQTVDSSQGDEGDIVILWYAICCFVCKILQRNQQFYPNQI